MKKSLVVLLIAVLALSAVFAADVAITVEGDVSASYVFDFDDMTGTYNVPELNGALAWELVLPVAKAGSEYPYIDVAGEIEVDLTTLALSLAPAVDFSTFAIVGEDWNVNFLAKIGTLDYAVSAIDTKWYCPKNVYSAVTGRDIESALTYRWASVAYYNKAVAISKDGVGTLTLLGTKADAITAVDLKTYSEETDVEKKAELLKDGTVIDTVYFKTYSAADDYVKLMNESGYVAVVGTYIPQAELYPVSVYAKKNVLSTTTFAVEGESEELKLSDSITTQFGFGFAKKEVGSVDAMNAGFSTKSSYEDILTVAADFGYGFEGAESFDFDIATSFKYEMVAVDVYFANADKLYYYQGQRLDEVANKNYYDYVTRSCPLLSAKASIEVAEIGTTFTFTGKDVLAQEKKSIATLAYKAVNTYFDNYTFTFDASTKLNTKVAVGFKAEADYSAEVGVTAYAGVSAEGATGSSMSPVFEAGLAYAKDGFTFSVDFSTEAEDYVCFEGYSTYPDFALTVKSGYEAETFTLSGAVEYNTHETAAYYGSYWSLDPGLYVSAGIESDKLVDGATLSLEYESCELLESHPVNGRYGTLTAAVTVEF